MLQASNWNYPTSICFGEGRIKDIAMLCQKHNIQHPFLVTDRLLQSKPFYTTLLKTLDEHRIPYNVFTEFDANPSDLNIATATEHFNEGKHDSVIVLGGGSAMDVAKTVAVTAMQSHPLWDFEDVGDNYLNADIKKIVPSIAIPTTAGTGSEVGRASIIVDTKRQSKRLIFHPNMLPVAVILDPETTLSVPPALTAATGLDAFAHNLEAFLSPGFHPMADGIALEGMRLIKENLAKAFQNPDDLNARSYLLVASTMGATAFQKGLGLIHSLSHPVGAIYNKHHGLLNAIFMPYALIHNRTHIETQCISLARHLDLPSHDYDAVLHFVISLLNDIDLPMSLKEIGIDDAKADEVANKAFNDPSTDSNPKPLTVESIKAVYLKAIEGILD